MPTGLDARCRSWTKTGQASLTARSTAENRRMMSVLGGFAVRSLGVSSSVKSAREFARPRSGQDLKELAKHDFATSWTSSAKGPPSSSHRFSFFGSSYPVASHRGCAVSTFMAARRLQEAFEAFDQSGDGILSATGRRNRGTERVRLDPGSIWIPMIPSTHWDP